MRQVVIDVRIEVAVLPVGGDRARVAMTVDAAAAGGRAVGAVDEERLAGDDVRVGERDLRQVEVRAAPERELECLHRVELVIVRQLEVAPLDAAEALREVLCHGANGALAQRAGARRSITGPAGHLRRRRDLRGVPLQRHLQAERVRHAAHHEASRRIGEAVKVLQDQAELPHQQRTLKLFQRRVELGHEQRIVGWKRGNERGVNHQVVARGMAGSAGAAIPPERPLEEELRALRDELAHVHPAR